MVLLEAIWFFVRGQHGNTHFTSKISRTLIQLDNSPFYTIATMANVDRDFTMPLATVWKKSESLLARSVVQTRSGLRLLISPTRGLWPTVCFVLASAIAPPPAAAQGFLGKGMLSSEVFGGTGGAAIDEGETKFSSPLVAQRPNTDATGKPCLNVHASAEKQTINAMIYNHLLLLDNHCTKEIRIRACYYKTDSCQEIAVHANNRQRYVFGVFTTPDFRFSYREYVN
jgi:hypothetical protein